MNWFERYGIPGSYFIASMAGWVYALYPSIWNPHTSRDLQSLVALAAVIFLPIGYVISILSQTVYLNWRRCFAGCPPLRGWLGFHGAALDTISISGAPLDEAVIEARTLLLTASRKGPLTIDTHLYMRNWIARRMDVVAINHSIIWATVFAGIIALVAHILQPGSPSDIAVIVFIISAAVVKVMILSIGIMRNQVIEVIAGIYRTYGLDGSR